MAPLILSAQGFCANIHTPWVKDVLGRLPHIKADEARELTRPNGLPHAHRLHVSLDPAAVKTVKVKPLTQQRTE